MNLFRRDQNKAAEKKGRDSKAEIPDVATPAVTSTAGETRVPPDKSTATPQKTVSTPKQQEVAATVGAAGGVPVAEVPATIAVEVPAPVTTGPAVVAAFSTMVPMQPVTESVVIQSKGNVAHEKEKEKLQAAASYLYGQKDDQSYFAEKKPSSSYSESQPRTNRAQELRQSRNLKRIDEEKMMREQMLKERIIRARSEMSSEAESDDDEEAGEPITARLIPKSLYHKPKINVRETLSSKFRYLFNRKPPGVTVYFKQTDDKNPKKKPPFVVSSLHRCF